MRVILYIFTNWTNIERAWEIKSYIVTLKWVLICPGIAGDCNTRNCTQLMSCRVTNVPCDCSARKCEQLEETSNQVHGQVWEHGANLLGYERQSPQQGPSHVSNGFFHPLEVAPEPTLQIGYDAVCTCSLLPVIR